MILEREQHGLVQVLRLNRPEAANSLNPELLRELGRAFHESETDDSTQVLVLTGAELGPAVLGASHVDLGDHRQSAIDFRQRRSGDSVGANGLDDPQVAL